MRLIPPPPPPEPSGSEVAATSPAPSARHWPRLRRLALALAATGALLLLWVVLAPMRGPVTPTPALGGQYGTGSKSFTLLGERLHIQGDTVYVWSRTGEGEHRLIGAACGAGQVGIARDGMPREFVPPIPGSIGAQILESMCRAAPITAGARLRYRARSLWPGGRGQLAVAQVPDAEPAPPAKAAGPVYMDSLMPR